jgi:hypothetical protein
MFYLGILFLVKLYLENFYGSRGYRKVAIRLHKILPEFTHTADGWEFESRQEQDLSPLRVVQTGSGAHTASYPMGTYSSFPEGKAAGA